MKFLHLAAFFALLCSIYADDEYFSVCDPTKLLRFRNKLHIENTHVNLTIGTGPRMSEKILAYVLKAILRDYFAFTEINIITADYTYDEWIDIMSCDVTTSEDNCVNVPMIHTGLVEINDANTELKPFVKSTGYLGLNLKLGWFVPGRLVDDAQRMDPGNSPDHYTFFKNPSNTARFRYDDQTVDRLTRKNDKERWCDSSKYPKCDATGQFVPSLCEGNDQCATLFAAFPNENYPIITQQIEALGLYVNVAWIGSPFYRFITLQMNKNVTYFDYSTSANTQDQPNTVIEVLFPSCDTLGTPAGCAYVTAKMRKLHWSFLEYAAPQIIQMFNNIEIKPEEYNALVQEATKSFQNEQSIQEVACTLKTSKNLDRWNGNINAYPLLIIHTIFPDDQDTLVPFVNMALDDVNRIYFGGVIIAEYRTNGECSKEIVLKQYINEITNNRNQVVGIVGPECNSSMDTLLGVAEHYSHLVVSYQLDSLSAENDHDFFFRIPPDTSVLAEAYVHFIKDSGWKNFALFSGATHFNPAFVDNLRANALKNDQQFLGPYSVNKGESLADRFDVMKNEQKAKIIIGDFLQNDAFRVMCEAYRHGMFAKHGFVWILPSWLDESWFEDPGEGKDCTTKQLKEAIDYTFIYKFQELADDNFVMGNGFNISQWKHNITSKGGNVTINGAHMYDAIWLLGSSLGQLLVDNPSFIDKMHQSDDGNTLRKTWISSIKSKTFSASTGNIHYVDNVRQPEKISLFENIKGELVCVGHFQIITDDGTYGAPKVKLTLLKEKIKWYNGKQPDDGTPFCAFQTLVDALDVSCDAARVLAISGMFVGSILILGLASGTIVYRYYERKMKMLEQNSNNSPFHLHDYELPEGSVRIYRLVGEGAFGKVYFGDYIQDEVNVTKVAIKAAKDPKNLNAKMELLSEAEVMKQFQHPNILQLIGVMTKQDKCQIVTEFMMYGNLKVFLQDRRHLAAKGDIGAKDLTRMAMDICRGLAYLASLNYVHGDLACRNCLVHESFTIKIADFGFCKNLVDQDYYRLVRSGPMPVRWMSPEVLTQGMYHLTSDIWSFGIVLYEIITFGGYPYHNLDDREVQNYIRNGNFPNLPQVSSILEALLLRIWSRNYEDRPSAVEIFHIFEENPELIHPCVEERSGYGVYINENDPHSKDSMNWGSTSWMARHRVRSPLPDSGTGYGIRMKSMERI